MSEFLDARLDAFREKLRRFVAERDWSQFHDPKNLAMAIASEVGELLSELRWVTSEDADDAVRAPDVRRRIENEVGDVAIALLLFCERAGIDLLAAAEKKLELNAANYPVAQSKGHPERPE
jgi:dCTP diphosphatase